MPLLVNHVKKYDVTEFENVLVPLTNAQRQPSVIAAHGERLGTMNGATVDDDGIESSDQYSAFTIEGFRAEIDNDITASGHDTVYDRMFHGIFLYAYYFCVQWRTRCGPVEPRMQC